MPLNQDVKDRCPTSENPSVRQPLSLNRCPFLCDPERSRGICSSTDLSWKSQLLSSSRIVISTGAQRNGETCGSFPWRYGARPKSNRNTPEGRVENQTCPV